MIEIGNRLRAIRKGSKLTQVQLAQKLGIQQSRINRYETGQSTPGPEIFVKYADLFDVSLDYLYCRTDDPHGKYYAFAPQFEERRIVNSEDMHSFIDMCFDPNSPYYAKLKETLIQMMEGDRI